MYVFFRNCNYHFMITDRIGLHSLILPLLINDFPEELQKNGMATFLVVRNTSHVNLVDMILTGGNQKVFC